MIPPLTDAGLLPPGIHSATITEFEGRFVCFQRSDRRLRVFDGLQRLLVEVRRMSFIKHIYIAGSYVTAKAEPNDFDCLLVVDGEQFPKELRPFEYRVLSRRPAAREFGGDVVTVADGSELHRHYLDFFQSTRDGIAVGMVELMP
jgi:hypothetical protein